VNLKLTITAQGRSREELLALALQALTHAVAHPAANGQRITNGISLFAPDSCVDYKIVKARPSRKPPVAVA